MPPPVDSVSSTLGELHTTKFNTFCRYISVRFSQHDIHSHCTRSWTLLLMDGGTPFEAMHRYTAMCSRLTLVMNSTSPSTTFTVIYTTLFYCFIINHRLLPSSPSTSRNTSSHIYMYVQKTKKLLNLQKSIVSISI